MQLSSGLAAFVVNEVPLYEPCGEGPHTYVRIEKMGLTTRDAITVVADRAGVRARDVGTAGQKDKFARTTQWMSLPPGAKEFTAGEQLSDSLQILDVSHHGNKLRTGHLKGNGFELTFDVDDAALPEIRQVMDRIASEGMRNYYGPQRFGRGLNNVTAARQWAYGHTRMRGKSARFKEELYASVLQSEVFNRYLTARSDVDEGLLDGEVVRLDRTRSVFVVEDVPKELERFDSGDLIPTGPMFGPKMVRAHGRALLLEDAAEAEINLDDDARVVVARRGKGTRRDLIVRPTGTRAEVASPGRVVVCFTLPSGSYATQLARELTRLSWDQPLRPTVE
jgi:tRNA pseudouridine13 synthase